MTGSSLRGRAALAAGLLALAFAGGCGGTRSYAPRTEFIPFTPEQRAEREAAEVRPFRIQPGDALRIRFAYEHALDQDAVLVLSDGLVSLVGVDPVRVGGMTITEADSALTAAYSKEYREPSLSVILLDTKGRQVFVMGEVRDPGVYQVPVGGIDIMSAIAMASGFTEDAARGGTVIVRATDAGYQFQEVDLDAIGKAGFAPITTVPLLPYDVVYVPRSRTGNFSYFAKAVLSSLANITQSAFNTRDQFERSFWRY